MSRKTYHVTPGPRGWRVRREGVARAASTHTNKADAIAYARALAKRADLGQVKVHRSDGVIQTEYTYGKDPRRSPG